MSELISLANVLPEKPGKFKGFWASVSKIKTYESCPLKFKFSYIDRLPKKTWDFHVLGKFAHFCLEYFELKRLEGDIRADNILMKEAFTQGRKEFPEADKKQTQEVYQMMLQYLQVIADQKAKDELPEVLAVEEEFYIDIAGKMLLMGFIDKVQRDPDGILHVADYKTSKPSSKKYMKKDKFQLLTYSYVKLLQDPSLKKVRASYIMLKDNFSQILFEFDRDEILAIEEKFLEDLETIQSDKLYRPNPSPLCGYCDFLEEHCEEGRMFMQQLESKKNNQDLPDTWGKTSW